MKQLFTPASIKYILVGATSLAIDYGLLLVLYHMLHVELFVAVSTSFFIGLIANFLLSKYWTFRAPRGAKHSARQVVLYGLLVAFNLLVTNVVIISFEKIHIGPEITKPFITMIVAVLNYQLYQHVIFNDPHANTDSSNSED